MQSNLRFRLPRPLIIASTLLIMLASVLGLTFIHDIHKAYADNIPGYTLDGLGNTYIINNPKYIHVQDHIDEAVVDANYDAQDGEAGAMRVYRDGDGSYVGRMVPDGTDGGVQGSWIDVISGGAKAIQRANGDILIVREENWLAKQIIYIWHPGN